MIYLNGINFATSHHYAMLSFLSHDPIIGHGRTTVPYYMHICNLADGNI